jgi:hypothetical protein
VLLSLFLPLISYIYYFLLLSFHLVLYIIFLFSFFCCFIFLLFSLFPFRCPSLNFWFSSTSYPSLFPPYVFSSFLFFCLLDSTKLAVSRLSAALQHSRVVQDFLF